MPSRFALYSNQNDIAKKYNIEDIDVSDNPYYNIKPTNRVSCLIKEDQNLKVVRMRWDYVKGKNYFKARSDNVASSKLFSKGFRERRCLILMNGFFEWNKEEKKSVPFYFKLKDEELFACAGIYNKHTDDENNTNYQFAIITVEANDIVGEIFHRMPAIIPKSKIDMWLTNDSPQEDLLSMLQPFEGDKMIKYQVNPLPARGDNGPDTIKEVKESSIDEFF
jgi:putative SOS response-associated peptidase YedK